ncbi:hypothetical protein UCRNP2_6623 [Neofusicoccum parvum UCRNP2]|uniref:Uncharacterized protein n=1 Tax=Botryosphaeria parva (strain UCR-NP2) TaxID=1287680 RepID=R1EFU4_BOTPV|nr:hypothetical protein UCRNP2_6623 [Neofusicoccum parvum UCRNP2]
MTHAPRWTLRAAKCRAEPAASSLPQASSPPSTPPHTNQASRHLIADVLLRCSPVAHGAAVPLGKAPTDAATFLSPEFTLLQKALDDIQPHIIHTLLRWRLETFESHLALVGSHLDLISVELDTLAIVVDSLAETPDLSCPDLP